MKHETKAKIQRKIWDEGGWEICRNGRRFLLMGSEEDGVVSLDVLEEVRFCNLLWEGEGRDREECLEMLLSDRLQKGQADLLNGIWDW